MSCRKQYLRNPQNFASIKHTLSYSPRVVRKATDLRRWSFIDIKNRHHDIDVCCMSKKDANSLHMTGSFNLFVVILNLSCCWSATLVNGRFSNSQSSNTPAVSGIEYIGRGYNLLTGNPFASSIDPGFRLDPIFKLTYTQNVHMIIQT